MNFYSLFMALLPKPLVGIALICAVSWLAALASIAYGYLSVAQSTVRSDTTVRDERAARSGWVFLAVALFLCGGSSLLGLNPQSVGSTPFAIGLVAVPLLCGIGLFKIFSPCLTTSESDNVAPPERDVEADEPTAKTDAFSSAKKRGSFASLRAVNRMTPRARILVISAFDAFIIGGSIAALIWWLCKNPDAGIAMTSASATLSRARDLATVLWFSGAAWIALNYPSLTRSRLSLNFPVASSTRNTPWRTRQNALKPIWIALLLGSLLFGIASTRLTSNASISKNFSLFTTILLMAAALCYAAAPWFLPSGDSAPENSAATVNDEGASLESEAKIARLQTTFRVARNFLTLLLPSAAAATGTWYAFHLKVAQPVGALPRNLLPDAEIWWNALLLLCASGRHLALNLYENLHTSRRDVELQRSMETLREEVAWRTQQLTTLHTVSADLNNTLSHEQVLNLALQRLMEAVRADAGAVWLLDNFEQIAANKTRDPRAFNAVDEEQERRKNELKTATGGAAATSSTRLASQAASPFRTSLADAFDAEQEKPPVRNTLQSVQKESAKTEITGNASRIAPKSAYNADASSSEKERLKAAIQSFHSLENLTLSPETELDKKSGATDKDHRTRNGSLIGINGTPIKRGDNGAFPRPFPGEASDDTNDELTIQDAFEVGAAASVSGHGLQRSRPLRSGFHDNEELVAQKIDTALESMEGDGVYVSGPVGSWGTFVASNAAIPEASSHTSPVLHLVSHTRDTYGTRKTEPTDKAVPTDRADAPTSTEAASKTTNDVQPEAEALGESNGVLDSTRFVHHNWRLVRANGYDTPATNRALEAMNRALEEGGIVKCARLSASWFGTIGDVHLAPIKWHGEVIGVLSVTSLKRHFKNADRRLLEALANEVSDALRNSYVYQQARRWAERDSVTNLFNHRAMQEKLGQELIHARNFGTELTVVMMDLNNFKFFNDTYGHPVGDRVLETVAQCLRESCRTSDVIGRYGGDEFIAVLPNTSIAQALDVCRRIEEQVESQPFSEGGDEERRIPIGLSFGAAVYPHDGKSSLELLTVADAHLYDAKRGGSPLARMKETDEMQELRKLKDASAGGSFGVLDALVTAIDHKDNYTRRHSEDVTHWAVLMGRELGFGEEELRAVRISGLLHDVGKIAVPDAVLRKPGRLDDNEFAILQQHPVFGALIVKDVPNLPEVLGGIRHHHERYDGKGYPDKLAGENIPLIGRLLAIPDCFSAMTTNRPYRKSLTWSKAFSEIERCSGTQFDPQMVDAFLEVMARIIAEQNAPAKPKEIEASEHTEESSETSLAATSLESH